MHCVFRLCQIHYYHTIPYHIPTNVNGFNDSGNYLLSIQTHVSIIKQPAIIIASMITINNLIT